MDKSSDSPNPTSQTREVRVVEPILIGANPDNEVTDQEALAILRHVRQLAILLDSAFQVPGSKVSFGIDSLIGLVPVVGDAISLAMSGYIIVLARQCGVSRWTAGRMVTNALIDFGFGVIPVAGDAFDVVWKANKKNVAILEKHLHKRFPHLKEMID